MDDPKEPAINTTTNTVNSEQQNVPEKKGASSWDERKDYIHRTNDKTKIPEDSEDKPKEKKRSGEYDLPPPPEY